MSTWKERLINHFTLSVNTVWLISFQLMESKEQLCVLSCKEALFVMLSTNLTYNSWGLESVWNPCYCIFVVYIKLCLPTKQHLRLFVDRSEESDLKKKSLCTSDLFIAQYLHTQYKHKGLGPVQQGCQVGSSELDIHYVATVRSMELI